MSTPLLLAQFWGIVMVIISVAMLVNRDTVKAVARLGEDKGMNIFLGFMATMGGVALILAYNVWVWDWTLIVTLLGWTVLLKGAFRLFYPHVTSMARSFYKSRTRINVLTIAMIIVGIYLIVKGMGL